MKYWETLSLTISAKPVGAWAWVSALEGEGRTIWIVDAHRDGKRFVVRAGAFLELETSVCIQLLTEQRE